ncbi:MAG: molybdopterin cofactor-binding domain-containing protein [Gammaproteobacteria bacterium]
MAADTPPKRTLTRRKFFIGSAALVGGGLALRWLTHEPDSLRTSEDILEPNAFLQITPDGRFIFQLDKVEMGQGTMTGLVTLVAEELDVSPERFEVQFAPVLPIFQRPIMMTGQSRSMVDSWDLMRETGAAARAMLIKAAADRWQVHMDDLSTFNGLVIDSTNNRKLSYAELATQAAAMSVPGSVSLKDPADYKFIGRHVPRLDIPQKIDGSAVFGIDVQLEDMLTAVVVRCPEIGGTLTNYDAGQAAAMPGVKGVVELPQGRGVAVVADGFWEAKQAAVTVSLSWDGGPLRATTDVSILAEQRRLLDEGEIGYETGEGEVAAALEEAPELLVEEYTTPYLVHATMEPMNATARVSADHCEVWAPTQAPDVVRQITCDILGLTRAQVDVHTTFSGGGFGRRVMWDYIEEVIWIAREFNVPVKLVWTREDDTQHGFFRQQTVHRMRGSLDADGNPVAWDHRQVAAPTGERLTPPTMSTLLPESISTENRQDFGRWLGKKTVQYMGAFQAREGGFDLKYAVTNSRFAQTTYDPGLPISIWRSVGNSYNAFVVESFIDELAHTAEQDPLAYRRKYLQQHPRMQAVLDKLEAIAEWGKQPNQGLAVFDSFGSVVGQVATVAVENNSIRVTKVVCVVDCGLAINPDIVRQQMEGGIIYGLTAALYGEVNIDGGKVRQSNFHDYRMLKLADSPDIEVHVLDSDADIGGVGEPGTPVIAPAVANAVFKATGQRLRSLPLKLQ